MFIAVIQLNEIKLATCTITEENYRTVQDAIKDIENVKTIFEAKEASPGDIVMVKMSGKRLKNMVFAEV